MPNLKLSAVSDAILPQYVIATVVVVVVCCAISASSNARFMCWSGFALVWWWWLLFAARNCFTFEYTRCDLQCRTPQPRVFFFARLLKPTETYFPHNVVLYRWVIKTKKKRYLKLINTEKMWHMWLKISRNRSNLYWFDFDHFFSTLNGNETILWK